ncbi:MAG: hypothetical protein PHE79_09645 [Eubacteriales bacterium]|nr:hypothetical protein [Eubacteriales bacterium]
MKLQDYVKIKENELIASGMRSVKYRRSYPVTFEPGCVSMSLFEACQAVISPDTEIEEVDRKSLPGKVDGLDVTFDVVKPRCRKSSMESYYVKIV